MIKIMYVGNKPHAFDNVARSGKSWAGKGDVQEVTDEQAKLLLKYKDQWALVNESDRQAIDQPLLININNEEGELVSIDLDDLNKPLEKMTKAEMIALAKQLWGKDIDQSMGKKAMIDQIEEWQQELGS